MSQENVEIVKGLVDAVNRQDWDTVFKYQTPGCEWDVSRSESPLSGVYRLDQFRGALVEFAGSWEAWRVEPHEFIEAGDRVVMHGTSRLKGREGIEVSATGAFVFAIRDGAIERVCLYQERQEALEAVGLSE
jgi:ketosteroid isomerase-like protein